MPDTYYVLLADLAGSRKVEDRLALAEAIEAELAELAEMPLPWVAAMRTTKGIDEMSGVFATPETAFDVAVWLNIAIWPQRFRFAFGAGRIDIGLETGDAAAMDGPVFHQTADALRRAKKDDHVFALSLPEEPAEPRDLVQATADLHDAIMRRWTPGNARAVRAYRKTGNQAQAAGLLHITQQAVSDALARADARKLTRAEEAIRGWFATLDT